MGGKSMKRSWSAEEVEKKLANAKKKVEQPQAKSLADMFEEEKPSEE